MDEPNGQAATVLLDDHQKQVIRQSLVDQATKLLGIKYEYGAEWTDRTKLPEALDCSEMIEGVFKIVGLRMEDGAQNQFNMTVPSTLPLPGDLAFLGKSGDIAKIYHVGIVYDAHQIIEARNPQPGASFETGKVILRPRDAWENFKKDGKPIFCGYRSHPKLV